MFISTLSQSMPALYLLKKTFLADQKKRKNIQANSITELQKLLEICDGF